MKTLLLISAALMMTACSTVSTGKKIVTTTGKVAAASGKIIYKTGAATGKAVIGAGRGTARALDKTTAKAVTTTGKAAAGTGKVIYKSAEVTGKTVINAGKGSVTAIDNVTSTEVVQEITRSPTPKNIDRIGDKGSFGEVALTPLSDINLRKQRIPKKLIALQTPYDAVSDQSCRGLMGDIREWDLILGEDMDSPRYKSRDAKGMRQLRETTLDLAEAGVGRLVPFRSVVRAATGATKHEKRIQREYRKGVARRSYLRGLAMANKC